VALPPALEPLRQAAFARAMAEYVGIAAFGILAYTEGGPSGVALLGLAQFLPAALLGPVAVRLLERLDRRRTYVGAGFLQAATAALAGLLVPPVGLGAVLTLAPFVGISWVMSSAAQAALVPVLAARADEVAIGTAGAAEARSAGRLLGALLAALALVFMAPEWVLLVAAALYLGGAALALRLPRMTRLRARGASRTAFGGAALAALRDPGVAPVLGVSVLLGVANGAIGAATTIVPLELLAAPNSTVALATAAGGVGALAGSVGARRLRSRRRLGAPIVMGLAVAGAPLILMGAAPYLVVAMGVFMLTTAGRVFGLIAATALITLGSRDDRLSTTLGAYHGLLVVGLLLGATGMPLVDAVFGVEVALAVTAAVIAGGGAAFLPSLHRVDRRRVVSGPELAALRANPVFAALPAIGLDRLGVLARTVALPAGTAVIRQGEPGDDAYLLLAGRAEVVRDGRLVAVVGPGDLVGEAALLREAPRSATVRTREPVRALVIQGEEFLVAVTGNPASLRAVEELMRERASDGRGRNVR
jgi:predicted MFS family arabinose efflux permease